MTKYLKQSAQVEHCVWKGQSAVLDEYGNPKYAPAQRIKCRREKYTQRGLTGQGQFINLTSTYYFDETAQLRKGDRIDGQEIQHIEEYVDGAGVLVGYEVSV